MTRHIASEVNDVHTLPDLVFHGLGVAVVPEHIARKKASEPPMYKQLSRSVVPLG